MRAPKGGLWRVVVAPRGPPVPDHDKPDKLHPLVRKEEVLTRPPAGDALLSDVACAWARWRTRLSEGDQRTLAGWKISSPRRLLQSAEGSAVRMTFPFRGPQSNPASQWPWDGASLEPAAPSLPPGPCRDRHRHRGQPHLRSPGRSDERLVRAPPPRHIFCHLVTAPSRRCHPRAERYNIRTIR